MRLLGLDPGLRTTGWGVIDVMDNRLRWVADGTVCSDADLSLAERLAQLHRGILDVIAKHSPQAAAVEETFVNQNPSSTLKLGQARGAVLLAASLSGLAVAEYAPRLVKQSLVGTGRAAKDQVGMMVRQLLPGCVARQTDSTDALAVAICHAHHHGTAERIRAALERAS
ncbi:crossover junction endodeoxyribonuclease RuvC [Telmatospirillum sp.]|uniref:crossover junction endodeoxyribonuclease RuvC n=1 Tax=Telmatospirillum sp. TaxID=2079197 RepID=UPI00284D7438|nr:crossover junction endodeoxyribonuclease RuvC [Telmatospirillum sp.]MDR3437962.1 crossover junction endodeoxyribonuclease RuvC [Telmatospirillum sp.]